MSDSASRPRRPPAESDSFLPDDWHALAPLVDAVLDAPAERRAEVLAELSAGDAARRAALERLVAECEAETPMLDRPAAERFARLLIEEHDTHIPEILGGRYRIARELGRGGMAQVYLARDTKHARDVAVKVIRPDLAASLGRDRFLREIAIAARLRHPNIVPLYDSGDADGLLYFVMPYEEGPSLRERLGEGAGLPVADCLNVLRDVARALAYAHERGVVHRDVKPDNVMMSGGAAVVTDFGIAKAVTAAQADSPGGTITQAGAGIGTPAYMAPEQAIGDPSTDHRADIYSFGCLAYELFTGQPPFHDLPTHQIIAAHVGTKPVPLSDVCAEAPEAVARLVERCLEKNPAARPQSAQELVAELDASQTRPAGVARRWSSSRRALWPARLVAAVIALGGTAYAVSRSGRSPADGAPGELTLAVLPLNSVAAGSLDGMADGFSDEVATALLKVPGVVVKSRQSVGKYRGRDVNPQQAGQELGARLLVMGGLRGTADKFTVTARLVDADDGSDLWAELFDRSDGDFSAVRDTIVRAIERTLRAKFGTPVGARVAMRQPNPEAYRLYLLAQGDLKRRGWYIRTSVDRFRGATRIDSLYAPAYSGLSLALALTPYFELTPAPAVAAEAIAMAERALSLDSTLAQPHVALGLVYQHAYQWDRAAAEYEAALRLRTPDDVEPLIQYGRHLLFRGRLDEGLRQFLMARNTEPASAVVSSWVAYAYYLRGQLDSAVVESERAFQSDSLNVTTLGLGSLVRLMAGRRDEARDFVARMPRVSPPAFFVLSALNDTAAIRKRVAEYDGPAGQKLWWAETVRANVALGRGDTATALAALERATDAVENWPSTESVVDPKYAAIRQSARFAALLRRVGLSELAASTSSSQAPR